jgi:hypothetical protein
MGAGHKAYSILRQQARLAAAAARFLLVRPAWRCMPRQAASDNSGMRTTRRTGFVR